MPADQVSRQRWQAIILTVGPAVFDLHIPTFDIAGFLQALKKRGHISRVWRRRWRAKKPDRRHRRLLTPRGQRPGDRRPAYKRDELPPPHKGTLAQRVGSKNTLPTTAMSPPGTISDIGRSQLPDRRHTHPTRDRRRELAGARLAALNLHIWRVLEGRLCRRGVDGLKIDDEINPVVFCVDGYTTVAFSTPNWYLETR
jgi:hypothetical protein